MDKIALFTTINQNYIDYTIRCFEIFNEKNPDKFDLFIVTNDPISSTQSDILLKHNIHIIRDSEVAEAFKIDWATWPSECYWYYKVPNILADKGYEFSMYVDCDNVCLTELDFSWLDDSFVLAGSPRMRNNLSEEIDAWYYLNAVSTPEKRQYLESSFDLINKDNIVDINSGVLIFNNQRWKKEGLYEKAVNLFDETKEAGYPMTDDDSLLGLLMLCTPKSFYKHIDTSWNWYYEKPEYENSLGGDDVSILHAAWVKPWVKDISNCKNPLLRKANSLWKNKDNMKSTIHIIGCPRNPSAEESTIDPFARTSYFLTTYLHRNEWNVNYYGYEESTIESNRKFGVVNIDWKNRWISHDKNDPPPINLNMERDFAKRVYESLLLNHNKGDVVICMWSSVIDFLVELGINNLGIKVVDGHIGHYNPSKRTSYHVYAGYSLKSWHYGQTPELFINKWHDGVIPPMAHKEDDYLYRPTEDKENFILFMSRLIDAKGIGIVMDVARKMPRENFKIAGQAEGGSTKIKFQVPDNVEFIGHVNGEKRKEVLSKAKAVMTPAIYFEPFGLTSVEAAISGTPIITTDWGGYADNVLDGITGFRCTSLYEFIDAINNIDQINSEDCRNWGLLHSAESLIKRWENYLIRIIGKDWYDLTKKGFRKQTFRR